MFDDKPNPYIHITIEIMKKTLIPVFIICFLITIMIPVFANSTNYLKVDTRGHLVSPQWEVTAFHNTYPVGKQGGIEFIIRDKRISTNGNVIIVRKTGDPGNGITYDPIPQIETPERIIDFENNTITLVFKSSDPKFEYTIKLIPKGQALDIQVNLLEIPNPEEIEAIYFQMEFFPDDYHGKSYITDNDFGNFPHRYTGRIMESESGRRLLPLATGNTINMAPESSELNIVITSNSGDIELWDERIDAHRSWFVIRTRTDMSKKNNAATLTFKPKIKEKYIREPVIAYSQVGYHPAHPKRIIIEVDQNDIEPQQAKLFRIAKDGSRSVVREETPANWGEWLRYRYLVFDISDIKKTGMYQIAYGQQTTSLFPISENVFKNGVWQPSLETFIPVQMCHMRVEDRGHIWHGACHLDDGLQAPAPLHHFDGFRQKSYTETKFESLERIPGMNQGGWHDAADDDINTGSTGRTTYHLALVAEEFNIITDRTTIDFEKREVQLHQPDGNPDVLQQVIQGVKWLLAPYRVGDHSFVGVISSSWETYLKSGDWSQFTDNLFYDPNLPPDSSNHSHSGVPDDRYIFTNKDTRTEFMVAGILSISARVLSEFAPEKSKECLRVAREIWEREKSLEPVFFSSVGTPRSYAGQKANAAVELFLTTGEQYYLDELVNMQDSIITHFAQAAWTISRVIDKIEEQQFVESYYRQLERYATQINERLNSNPFGIHFSDQIWGLGWNNLWRTVEHFFLVKNHPELFHAAQVHNPLFFNLGVHYGSNHSFVTAVGNNSMIPAFGINKSHYSNIPGGSFSGTGILFPDFPELKDNHPFLWQQSEYIVFGGSAFIFCVLASEFLAEREITNN